MRPKVFVTRAIPSPGIELLSESCDVAVFERDEVIPRDELLRRVVNKDGLLCLLSDKIDRDLLEAAKTLRVISTYSVGFDHIDVAEATGRGIPVGYTADVLTDATADHAFALLASAARRIVEADRYLRAGKWKGGFDPKLLLGDSIWGATLGIIGFGRIGRAVAMRAHGFRMKVLYYDATRLSSEEEKEAGVEYSPLKDLLGDSDFVTIHTPYIKETHHLMDEERLRLMKQTAILINTSRGPIVDERALVRALNEKWLSGAALDVYEQEPIDPRHPLLQCNHVTLVPHIGSATRTARSKMAELAAKNLLAGLRGEPPICWLNPEAAKVRPLSALKML